MKDNQAYCDECGINVPYHSPWCKVGLKEYDERRRQQQRDVRRARSQETSQSPFPERPVDSPPIS